DRSAQVIADVEVRGACQLEGRTMEESARSSSQTPRRGPCDDIAWERILPAPPACGGSARTTSRNATEAVMEEALPLSAHPRDAFWERSTLTKYSPEPTSSLPMNGMTRTSFAG